MSALRVAARRLPRATRLVPSLESPVQRRFAATATATATSNAPQNTKRQVQVCDSADHIIIQVNLTNYFAFTEGDYLA